MPLSRADAKTWANGTNRNKAINRSATVVNPHRTQRGSVRLRACPPNWEVFKLMISVSWAMDSSMIPMHCGTGLQPIDRQKQGERYGQHHDPQRSGSGIIILFQFRDDQKGRDLGFHGHITRDKDDRTIFPNPAG